MKAKSMMLGMLFGLAVFASSLFSGVIMVSTHTTTGRPNEKQVTKIYIESDRVRFESSGAVMNQVFIFRQDKELFWIIDQKSNTYMEMTKQDMQKMKEKLDQAKAQMEAQMKNMPPEQRQMMEKMMKGRMPMMQQTAPPITYKKVASSEKVNQWVCSKYEGYRDDGKVKDIWTTDWKSLGLTAESFKAMKDLSEFFVEFAKEMASSFDQIGSEDWEKEKGYAGVPVKTIFYNNGQARSTTELTEVRQENLSAALFELPANLTKKEMPVGQR